MNKRIMKYLITVLLSVFAGSLAQAIEVGERGTTHTYCDDIGIQEIADLVAQFGKYDDRVTNRFHQLRAEINPETDAFYCGLLPHTGVEFVYTALVETVVKGIAVEIWRIEFISTTKSGEFSDADRLQMHVINAIPR